MAECLTLDLLGFQTGRRGGILTQATTRTRRAKTRTFIIPERHKDVPNLLGQGDP